MERRKQQHKKKSRVENKNISMRFLKLRIMLSAVEAEEASVNSLYMFYRCKEPI